MILGQFLPASERCDDPLLAVLESPSTVQLILDQMFMHIRPLSIVDASTSPVTTSEQQIDKINSPTTADTSQGLANEEDDAGGGRYIFIHNFVPV